MTVARIINEKGRDVVTASASMSLAEIAATLAEKRIGAVVVMDGDTIRGIVSERDLVRAIARHGGDALTMLAAEWMTAKVITCGPEDTIDDVMQKMTNGPVPSPTGRASRQAGRDRLHRRRRETTDRGSRARGRSDPRVHRDGLSA